MASSVTLPGGTTKYTLPVGADATTALTAAIKSEFAASKNITMNVVGTGKPGITGDFNAVLNKSGSTALKLTAGTGVQAIFDIGTGKDTLVGGTSTSLIYGNASATKGDSISVSGKATVFGTAGADTLSVTNANATAYLEGGKNIVNLAGSKDTLTAGGTGTATVNVTGSAAATVIGGAGAISVVGGTGALTFTHGVGAKDTVSVAKTTATDTFSGALTDKNGGDLFNIAVKAGGSFKITNFSGTTDKITITGATTAQVTAALKAAHTVKSGTSIQTTLTIGTDKITVIGGALTKTNFT